MLVSQAGDENVASKDLSYSICRYLLGLLQAQRDADRERRLRADSETRAKQALQETARCRSRLKLLTTEFQR
ncbi:unnamed protein product [Phaedon cochleariae]|uniref:Uncharacterized protein n=1 Tax=Phaedon cochleariae TaxID=80249 RepID=A0A9N9SI35_PHACE|nr:unnamed protein product [Phaedon cochleariae]